MSIMMREIAQQPEALDRTLRAERSRVRRFFSKVGRRIDLVILVARGTSDNAALFGRYLIEITTGMPVSLAAPSVHTLYRSRFRLNNTLVVGISQSGEGTDINLVLENCKKAGALVIAVTNTRTSSLAAIADEAFVTRAGKERSVAATKTYTCQLMFLYMLAEALRGGDFKGLEQIPDYAQGALALESAVESMIERYRFMEQCTVVGRGLNYSSAYEMAIKLMETCYIMADRFSSADFLHDIYRLAKRLRGLEADSLIISSEESILRLASCALKIPISVPDLYSPIPYIIPGQIFAAKLSRLKGLSPDRPRNLSKITKTL